MERQNHESFIQRAPRFPIRVPIRYRACGQPVWCNGTVVNISRTGILFRTADELRPKTMVEMRVQLPSEITGSTPASVTCFGAIVRTEGPEPPDPGRSLAATIVYYSFKSEGEGGPHDVA